MSEAKEKEHGVYWVFSLVKLVYYTLHLMKYRLSLILPGYINKCLLRRKQ